MPLGVIPMIYFGILRIFGEKNAKEQKLESRHFEPLRRSIGNPRRDVALRRKVGCLATTRSRCPKRHPSGTLRRRHYSMRTNFWIFGFLFRKPRIHTPIV